MMEPIIPIIVSGLISILAAYLTATYKTNMELEKERTKRHYEVVLQQKYNYLLPFKYCSDEFRGRLKHITKRLSESNEKQRNMIIRFQQSFNGKDLKWYFSDEIGPGGGYCITSTIYMNCTVFYWIKRIQMEYPYIPLVLPDNESVKSKMDVFMKYYKEEKDEKKLSIHCGGKYLTKLDKKCEIDSFIKNIKIIIAGEYGIPYGLHDSYGDFMYRHSENRIINYEEFCLMLLDENKRIKFNPILNFWTGLVSNEGRIHEKKFRKLNILVAILELLKEADVRANKSVQ